MTVQKSDISLSKVVLGLVAAISACTLALASNVSSAVAVGPRPNEYHLTSKSSMLGSVLKLTTN